MFSFLDMFWGETEEIRKIICKKIGIDDFGVNFEYLQKKYQKRRRMRKYMKNFRRVHGSEKEKGDYLRPI